jgi:hypothetical protein
MFTFHLSPDPISPALIQFCIGGLQSLIDIDFIQGFAPETAVKLHAWPLDHTIPLDLSHVRGQVTAANLALEHLNMMVSRQNVRLMEYLHSTPHFLACTASRCNT